MELLSWWPRRWLFRGQYMLWDWKFFSGLDAVGCQWARHTAQTPTTAKSCAYRRRSILHCHRPFPASGIICLLRPPFFCSHWPLPVTVVPQGTRGIPSTDTGADIQQLSVVRRWLLRWAKICFYTTFFRLSPKRKDSLKLSTDSSWKPRGISSGPQRCTH